MNLVVLRPGSIQRFEAEGEREIVGFERTARHINPATLGVRDSASWQGR
jgi:hypothetical protein